MIVFYSLAFVIGLLVISAIGWNIWSAVAENRDLRDCGYREDRSEGFVREMGPEELGTEAVLNARFARGEIDSDTYQKMIYSLHHTVPA